jgi:phosphoribosyl 1,2-cyclic phosphate phosphodiesterase
MQIEFLGTGGAITTPRPGCDCPICAQARERGVPYSRSGPCVFVHGPDILIDTPEEIKDQLNRSRVGRIGACFYSHWHPDHTMGRRVWEMNHDFRHWPQQNRRTDIYLPQQVAADFRTRLGLWEHMVFLERGGLVRLVELADGEQVELGGVRVAPFRLAEDYVYAFLLEGGGVRVLIAPDELFGWEPPPEVRGLDLAVLPMGIVEFDVWTGERRIPEAHPVLKSEATYRQTLEIARKLAAKQVILTHIEEPDGLSYDDLLALEQQVRASGLNVTFAYDTMVVDI